MKILVATILGGVVLLACASPMTGILSPEGYKHNTYNYEIETLAGSERLLPREWMIDNMYQRQSSRGEPRFAPKGGRHYKTRYWFDLDGDGEDDIYEDVHAYDLRYVHRVSSGVIWVRTVPIARNKRDKDLRVLAKEYVDGVAGAGYELVSYGRVEERRFAAEILGRRAGTVAEKPAFAVDFAVANIDEVQVREGARRTRVRLVVIRSGFEAIRGRNSRPVVKKLGGETHGVRFPVLLMMGFASQPEDYDNGVRDFDTLVARLSIEGKSGVQWKDLHAEAVDTTATMQQGAATAPTPGTDTAPKVAESDDNGNGE